MAGREWGRAHCRALPVSTGPAAGGEGLGVSGPEAVAQAETKTPWGLWMAVAWTLHGQARMAPSSLEEPSPFPGCGLNPGQLPSTLCVLSDFANLITVLSELFTA